MLVALAVNAATPVAAGAGTLTTAITDATAGDTLVLGSGSFSENGDYSINKNIVIMADAGATPVVSNHYYFKVDGGAQVTFKGIEFDAKHS